MTNNIRTLLKVINWTIVGVTKDTLRTRKLNGDSTSLEMMNIKFRGGLLGLKRLHRFLEVTVAQVRNRSRFGINKWYQSLALRNFDLEDMELESTNSGPTAKLPILKLGEASHNMMMKELVDRDAQGTRMVTLAYLSNFKHFNGGYFDLVESYVVKHVEYKMLEAAPLLKKDNEPWAATTASSLEAEQDMVTSQRPNPMAHLNAINSLDIDSVVASGAKIPYWGM
ncbi:hypothetical protein Tco_0543641 [Tanacetum coccineum]